MLSACRETDLPHGEGSVCGAPQSAPANSETLTLPLTTAASNGHISPRKQNGFVERLNGGSRDGLPNGHFFQS